MRWVFLNSVFKFIIISYVISHLFKLSTQAQAGEIKRILQESNAEASSGNDSQLSEKHTKKKRKHRKHKSRAIIQDDGDSSDNEQSTRPISPYVHLSYNFECKGIILWSITQCLIPILKIDIARFNFILAKVIM